MGIHSEGNQLLFHELELAGFKRRRQERIMAKVVSDGAGGAKYPPAEFSQKYSRVLAPKNFLSTPEEVFGEGKLFDKEVEEKTRLAFRVTMKKLDKLNTLSEERREELAREKIDLVVECFPNSLPEDLPKILGKTKWSMPAKEMEGWDQWWGMHAQVESALRGQARRIGAWWSFTGRPHPGEDEVLASLKRLASGVLTHPVTIGQMIDKHTPKRKKDKPKSIHLMGTDRPEATMIYAGFFIEILNANPGNPIKITLVSPDPANQQLAHDCSPKAPMLINPNCKLTAWDGLYHDFWSKFINTKKVGGQMLQWESIRACTLRVFLSSGSRPLTFYLRRTLSLCSPCSAKKSMRCPYSGLTGCLQSIFSRERTCLVRPMRSRPRTTLT